MCIRPHLAVPRAYFQGQCSGAAPGSSQETSSVVLGIKLEWATYKGWTLTLYIFSAPTPHFFCARGCTQGLTRGHTAVSSACAVLYL